MQSNLLGSLESQTMPGEAAAFIVAYLQSLSCFSKIIERDGGKQGAQSKDKEMIASGRILVDVETEEATLIGITFWLLNSDVSLCQWKTWYIISGQND